MVCDMTNHDSIEHLRRLKEVEATKASIYFLQPYNIMCRSLHDIYTYTTKLPRGNSDVLSDYIRAMKHCLPGPIIAARSYAHKKLQHAYMFFEEGRICSNKFDEKA
nr:DHBP synthase RibB-like alpha/beta domain-containing protein [Tanacetum cinerariifolium]